MSRKAQPPAYEEEEDKEGAFAQEEELELLQASARVGALTSTEAQRTASRLRLLHGTSAACYGILFLVTLVLLGVGHGTRIHAGYSFGHTRIDDTTGESQFVVAFEGSSKVVAEALVPVYSLVLCVAHGWLAGLVTGQMSDWMVRAGFNPLHALKDVVAWPLLVAQLAVMVHIADVEKVTLLVFLTFATVLLNALSVWATAAYHLLGRLAMSAKSASSQPRSVQVLLTTEARARRHLKYVPRLLFTLGCVCWGVVWIVLWTNAAWQENRDNAPAHVFALFIFALLFNVLQQVHQVVWMARADRTWATGPLANEAIRTLTPLATAMLVSYVALK